MATITIALVVNFERFSQLALSRSSFSVEASFIFASFIFDSFALPIVVPMHKGRGLVWEAPSSDVRQAFLSKVTAQPTIASFHAPGPRQALGVCRVSGKILANA